MIRALVFDFDGLILDTETPLIDAYAEVHAAHGVVFDRAVFLRSVGHADYAFDPWSPRASASVTRIFRLARFRLNQPRHLLEPYNCPPEGLR
jgi:beta-phosphoglucomutase-like phosphatase (HAD superfamily)